MKLLVAILCVIIFSCSARKLYYCKEPFVPPANETCDKKSKVFTYDWRIEAEDKCKEVECCACTGTYNIWPDSKVCNELCIS
ncbi:hypothetical protein Y032_0021g313 [Ancylostoma ceylanicum]|uniref:BPTI/Kunitz inhibitor domain-containing protein n=1 Tax=Ancylostoma ceylanicum TaxID=53326 RepID=A0A016V1M2_9BILA|nr:hypothetical protein Y032_0021g313 [Ancylostoma ceylanicum]